MKLLLIIAYLLTVACRGSSAADDSVITLNDRQATGYGLWRYRWWAFLNGIDLGTCASAGASISVGIGASEITNGWTYQTCERYAKFTNQIALFFDTSAQGATSSLILADQAPKITRFNRFTRGIDGRVIFLATGGNDVLALLFDPVIEEFTNPITGETFNVPLFIDQAFAVYTPTFNPLAPKPIEFVRSDGSTFPGVQDPDTGIFTPQVPEGVQVQVLVKGAFCLPSPTSVGGFLGDCPELFGRLLTQYEKNLRRTLSHITRFADDATVLFRLEYNSFDESNCIEKGAGKNIPPEVIAVIVAPLYPTMIGGRPEQSIVDFFLEGNSVFGIEGLAEGLNGVARRVAGEFPNVVAFDTFATFKEAALSNGDLVTDDCIHPNDDGHATIADLAFAAWRDAN